METVFALSAELPLAAPPKPQPQNRFSSFLGAAGIAAVNRSGLPGLSGAFFEDAFRCAIAGDVYRPETCIGREGDTKPDLEIAGHDTLIEVKSGTDADPMRFSVSQLEDYLWCLSEEGIRILYCFIWYRGKNEEGKRTTLAALGGERGKRAIAQLHRHLTNSAIQALVLDAEIVGGMAKSLRDEVASLYAGNTIGKVGRVLHTVVDSAVNGDPRGRAILKDFAPDFKNWRRVTGELPLGGYGEMYATQDATRRIPITGILRATHADDMIRHGGPFSRIFSEEQLPKRPYRVRVAVDPDNVPF